MNHKKIIVLVLAVAILYVLLGPLGGIGYIIWYGEKAKQRQIHLFSETDYQVLLKACRELSKRVTVGDLEPNHYAVRWNPRPEVSTFPKSILDLKPTYVSIDIKRKVMIELHGGFYNFGVMAYPEDYQYDPNLQYGEKQLIPGLWYYDDDYRDEYPKHKKKIDALILKGKIKQKEKNLNIVSGGGELLTSIVQWAPSG